MNYNFVEYVTFYSLCSVFDMLSDHLDSHLQRIKKQFNIVKSFLIRIPTSKVSWAGTADNYSSKYKVSLYLNFPYTSVALLEIIEYYFYSTLTACNTMRTNIPKLLDLPIFCIYSLNFSLEFFIMIFFCNKSAKY